MKTFFASLIITCLAALANAQTVAPLYQNQLRGFAQQSFSTDSNSYKLTPPQLFKAPPAPRLNLLPGLSAPAQTGNNNTIIVYSRMPVAHLQSNDDMPVAKPGPDSFNLGIKKVEVIGDVFATTIAP